MTSGDAAKFGLKDGEVLRHHSTDYDADYECTVEVVGNRDVRYWVEGKSFTTLRAAALSVFAPIAKSDGHTWSLDGAAFWGVRKRARQIAARQGNAESRDLIEKAPVGPTRSPQLAREALRRTAPPAAVKFDSGVKLGRAERDALAAVAIRHRSPLAPGDSDVDRFPFLDLAVEVRWVRFENGAWSGVVHATPAAVGVRQTAQVSAGDRRSVRPRTTPAVEPVVYRSHALRAEPGTRWSVASHGSPKLHPTKADAEAEVDRCFRGIAASRKACPFLGRRRRRSDPSKGPSTARDRLTAPVSVGLQRSGPKAIPFAKPYGGIDQPEPLPEEIGRIAAGGNWIRRRVVRESLPPEAIRTFLLGKGARSIARCLTGTCFKCRASFTFPTPRAVETFWWAHREHLVELSWKGGSQTGTGPPPTVTPGPPGKRKQKSKKREPARSIWAVRGGLVNPR